MRRRGFETFAALLTKTSCWCAGKPIARQKLRTLLCTVARNILSNQARVQIGRRRLLEKHAQQAADDGPLPVTSTPEASEDQVDFFYAAWRKTS